MHCAQQPTTPRLNAIDHCNCNCNCNCTRKPQPKRHPVGKHKFNFNSSHPNCAQQCNIDDPSQTFAPACDQSRHRQLSTAKSNSAQPQIRHNEAQPNPSKSDQKPLGGGLMG